MGFVMTQIYLIISLLWVIMFSVLWNYYLGPTPTSFITISEMMVFEFQKENQTTKSAKNNVTILITDNNKTATSSSTYDDDEGEREATTTALKS